MEMSLLLHLAYSFLKVGFFGFGGGFAMVPLMQNIAVYQNPWLINGDRVEIRGLCSFYVKKYKSYAGRNPKTGKEVTVKPKKLPFFKCGKELKERVNNR